jgi:CheY-like chemotaxis protein
MAVESELGKGTTFRVYLPAAEGVEWAPGTRPSPPVGQPTRGKGRVLIMDDMAAVRQAAGAFLKFLGYEVYEAEDGAATIAAYRAAAAAGRPIDVVILDLTVPGGMGGAEALKRLREIDPGVKALVTSGYSDDPAMTDCARFGFRGVLAKPYQMVEIADKVAGLLGPAEGPRGPSGGEREGMR